jgi:hypothetical protein
VAGSVPVGDVRRQCQRRVPARLPLRAPDGALHDRRLGTVGPHDRLLGAYTTFSTLSFETYRLIEDGAIGLAVANSLGSLAAGLVAVYLGVVAGRAF